MNPVDSIRQAFTLADIEQSELLLAVADDEAQLPAVVEAIVDLEQGPLHATAEATTLRDATRGGFALVAVRRDALGWLNQHRPLLRDRHLKTVFWVRPDVADAFARQAPDLFDWLTRRVDFAPNWAMDGHGDEQLTLAFWHGFPAGLLRDQAHAPQQFSNALARVVRELASGLPQRLAGLPLEDLLDRALADGLGRQSSRKQLFAFMPPLLAPQTIEVEPRAALALDLAVLEAASPMLSVDEPLIETWLTNAERLTGQPLVDRPRALPTPALPHSEFAALVELALEQKLAGPDHRRRLLEGLPAGFIASLPSVSGPRDQLRFDVMELLRTPRLMGLSEPPLAVWLGNAAALSAGQPAARFAALRKRMLARIRSGSVPPPPH